MKRQRSKKRVVIGLTGSFGTGKTTVAGIFRSLGAQVIDADRIAHAVISPGSVTWRRIVKVFGRGILKRNRAIDRRKLARAVFGEARGVERINAIVHPVVIQRVNAFLRRTSKQLVVIDAPLLIEAGLGPRVDTLVVVRLNRRRQIQRLRKKTHLSVPDIVRRIRAQMPLSTKIKIADFIIDNNGTPGKTKRQVEAIIKKLDGR
jgi:dephospho-CoA kinase